MKKHFEFDYYYGSEAEQFSFFRIPRLMIKDARFKELSAEAKILYGLMLDRLSLSKKSGWIDEENRVFIHYKKEIIMEDLCVSSSTATKILAELDTPEGIGLIERKRQGLGKPDIIYVKNFITGEDNITPPAPDEIPEKAEPSTDKNPGDIEPSVDKIPNNTVSFTEVQKTNFKKSNNDTSRSSKNELPEVPKTNFQKFKKQTSGGLENGLAEVQKPNSNYNNDSYIELSYINPISQSENDRKNRLDTINAYINQIRQNVDYDKYMLDPTYPEKDRFKYLFRIICDTVTIPQQEINISGVPLPYEIVRSRFLELTDAHLNHVIDCVKKTTTKKEAMIPYLMTCLFKAPVEFDAYLDQKLQYDYASGLFNQKYN